MIRSKRGSLLMDVMITVFLLGVAGAIFSSTYPAGIASARKAQNYKVALAIAQKKMEQLRAMNYESLSHPLLVAVGAIDSSPGSVPYEFTQVDSVDDKLPDGVGRLTVEDVNSTVRRVIVTVTWQDKTGAPARAVTLTSLFADKRTRRVI